MIIHYPDTSFESGGFFLTNLLRFGRLLRGLEIPVSSQQIYNLAEGVMYIDIASRNDFYYASRAFLLHDIDKLQQFDLAFDLFWSKHLRVIMELSSNRKDLNHEITTEILDGQDNKTTGKGALASNINTKEDVDEEHPPELDVRPVYSPIETLYHKDFADLSRDELREAKKIIRKLAWQLGKRRTRRKIRSIKKNSYLDFRRSLRSNLSTGEEFINLEWQQRKVKPRPFVLICDISGSMERYSQIFLYFLYALVQDSRQIETFVFGTRLTRLTPALRKKNVEYVLGDLSNSIEDWSGGTRIGESIKEFNFRWARRILGRGAIVIIISDGWDRGNLGLLEREISRTSRTATRLIWLNPLAGSPDYQPLVGGIQTAIPYIDDFYPLKNLNNLQTLAVNLGALN